MIIKFQSNDSWYMFDEVDSLEYRYLRVGEKIASRSGVLDYMEEPSEDKRVELCFLNKNQLEPSQVFADCPVYVLNNEGRTIDKL
ncbi:MAG: hypothetical protein Q7J27_02585 [Syntrophales bacterium]|nr:hypothetical protein [Syntrophales bacterium]